MTSDTYCPCRVLMSKRQHSSPEVNKESLKDFKFVNEKKVNMETIVTALDHFESTLKVFGDEFVNHL